MRAKQYPGRSVRCEACRCRPFFAQKVPRLRVCSNCVKGTPLVAPAECHHRESKDVDQAAQTEAKLGGVVGTARSDWIH